MSHRNATVLPDDKQLLALEEKFDPEMRFRPSVPPGTLLISVLLIALSCFHSVSYTHLTLPTSDLV